MTNARSDMDKDLQADWNTAILYAEITKLKILVATEL